MDLRVGGAWRHVMQAPNGARFTINSIFEEVVAPERLVLRTSRIHTEIRHHPHREEEDQKCDFQQKEWEAAIRPFYDLKSVLSTPSRDAPPEPNPWLSGCLQRVRAFGIYDQSDPIEYAVALVIALWRWCKFAVESSADRGRRVIALQI